ncbi:hypothetical protein [Oscillibacter sp.]|uniref:hypothetical protein n=1 Tax=Oscillibacter sp. TaxID=1945593 RepID=UPI0028A8FA4E|nr:hypothetical protein [Oscillibacter sp.]
MGAAERISVYQAPGMEYNEERCKWYVINQAGNPIDACIKMYGIEEFVNMIENRETKKNPKYDLMIQQHKFEVLANKVDFYFGSKGNAKQDDEVFYFVPPAISP